MARKDYAKFKGKMTRSWKNNIRYLVSFHVSSWKSKNLHFDGLLLSKAYKVLDEKVQKSCVSWHWRVMQNLRKNWLLVPKMTKGILWILMRAVTSLKICTLMCYFGWKYIMFESKKYRELCVITLENDAKFEEELTSAFENDMRYFANFDPTLKSLKIYLLIGSFWPK